MRQRLVRCLAALVLPCLALLGCTPFWAHRPSLPRRNEVSRGQLLIHCEATVPENHRLLDELVLRRDDVYSDLALPASDEPIHVYLFDNGDSFRRFIRGNFPSFPDRRAFFVSTDTRLSVYAHWGDRVAEDLRHEVVHGYLHAVVPGIPLWIDEGLAEFYEVPRSDDGLNTPHIQLLMQHMNSGWRPNLARLETLVAAGQMQQLDYAESWAWAHFLLKTTPSRKDTLRFFLQDVRREGNTTPLSARLYELERGDAEPAMVNHVRELAYK